MKRMLASVLALAMIFTLAAPVFAEELLEAETLTPGMQENAPFAQEAAAEEQDERITELAPEPDAAEENVVDGEKGADADVTPVEIHGGERNTDYIYYENTGELWIYTSTPLTISGEFTGTINQIKTSNKKVPNLVANLTFSDVTIRVNSNKAAPLLLGSGTSLNLTLKGENVLCGKRHFAAIEVPYGTSLTINGDGELVAKHSPPGDRETSSTPAGIGEGSTKTGWGNITINGGTIEAQGYGGGAGIGGAGGNRTEESKCGEITINGGTVTAVGSTDAYQGGSSGNGGAGIGSGSNIEAYPASNINVSGGTITINGGKVTATGAGGGAGIGGGRNASAGNITITNGTVAATGSTDGAAIGSGYKDSGYGKNVQVSGGTIAINGGTVTATSAGGGAGIGGGTNASVDKITIAGGEVTATGSSNGAGIGSGRKDVSMREPVDGGTIVISDGTVTATSAGGGAGIGGGKNMSGGKIVIAGGTVTATGSPNAAGIGSGQKDASETAAVNGGDIAIIGGTVTAKAGSGSASDIGKGYRADIATQVVRTVEVTNGTGPAKVDDAPAGIAPDDAGQFVVTGAVTLPCPLPLGEGKTLVVPQGASLTVPENTEVSGKIQVDGELINDGTLNGEVTNTGTLTNGGTVTGAITNAGEVANSGTINGEVTNNSTLTNNGTIQGDVVNDGTLANSGLVEGGVTNNNTMTNDGTLQGDIINEGTFTNSGTMDGEVTGGGDYTDVGPGTDEPPVTAPINPDRAIKLNQTSLELQPGETAKLKATLTPADATYKYIFWASSDEAVATVSDSGLVTAVAEGTATVTAKSWYGNTATCEVTAKKADVPTPPDEPDQPDTPDLWPTEGLAGFVTRCYRVALSREPDNAGHADWVRWLQDGTVDATSCTYGFVFSKEMNNKKLSDQAFVETLYKLFMDREGEAEGVTFWTDYLKAGHSREEVFHGFADSIEFARLKASYGIA